MHDLEDEPQILYHEIDESGFESRKIEIYKDESFGLASTSFSFGGTELSEEVLPQIEEINTDSQFKAHIIEKKEFDETWEYYNMFLSINM